MISTVQSPLSKQTSILLADDDNVTRNLVKESLEVINPRWAVAETPSLRDLLNSLKLNPIDLLISNLALDGGAAFELMAQVGQEHPGLPVVMITESPSAQMRNFARRLGSWAFLTRPVEFEQLAEAVEGVLDESSHSRVEGFNLVSFLQLMEMDRKSGTLRVSSVGERGTVCFRDGVPTFARTRSMEGDNALIEMLGWVRPEIRVFESRETDEENLRRSLKGLLLDGCQQIDERLHGIC